VAQERFGLKKRTLNVCFIPNSGHKWVAKFMSAFDPKRTLVKLGGYPRDIDRTVWASDGPGQANHRYFGCHFLME